MAKKKKEEAKSGGEKGGKELKIVTYHVITRDKVVANERQMSLLYIIDRFGPLHEKTLMELAQAIQEMGYELGYTFKQVGGSPFSPELKNDLIALMYVGFVETEPNLYRKLKTTSDGKDALEKATIPQGLVDVINKNFEKLRNKASIRDQELDLEIRKRLEVVRRPRRRGFF
ncbi:MAG: hypothetical protein GSR78_02690 [Desulfurococcales archaeon]|nr:hypothetical protein [Desulfurococcales archaeon]